MSQAISTGLLLMVAATLAGSCGRDSGADAARPASSHLRIAMRSAPLSLDPHLRNEIVTSAILGNIYETLVSYDKDGRLMPSLAENWENPDDRTWRLVLRDGVTFHDGHPFTVDDAVFSLERARRHPETNFDSLMVEVQEIRRINPRTLEISTLRPYPPLLSKLAFIQIAPQGSPEHITAPIGTGPWRLVASSDPQRLEFERFENYWGTKPGFARATIVTEPDPTVRLALLTSGAVDVAQTIPSSLVESIKSNPCCRVLERDGLLFEYLALDPRKPPFTDIRVRRAVDLAIDRERLVAESLNGHGDPLGQLAPLNVFGHDPAFLPQPPDLQEVKRLLTAAGFPNGVEIVVETREGRDVQWLVAQLNEAGFEASARELPWAEMYQRLNDGLVAAYLGGLVCISADASDALDSLAHSRDLERGYGAHNRAGYHNPEVDRLIENAGLAKDIRERRELLGMALRLSREDSVFLPLYSRHEIQAVRVGVDLKMRLDGLLRASDVSVTPQ